MSKENIEDALKGDADDEGEEGEKKESDWDFFWLNI